MERSKELAFDGWKWQGSFDEPRLSEVCRLYGEIGFDVRVEPFVPDGSGACSECMKACPGRFMTVYTRKSKAAVAE
jgi:hypothetical protein